MDIFLMQEVIDGIPNSLMSQTKTRTIGSLIFLRIIIIDIEFILYLIGQEVYSQGKGI